MSHATDRMSLRLEIRLESYIGHPYWPEMAKLVDITKTSGMSRARTAANARMALEQHLKSLDKDLAWYDQLKILAERPFYVENGHIVVPELHVMSMIVAVCDTIRAAGRPAPPDQVRSVIRASAWKTDRIKPDGVWERFAVVSSGTGAKLSNQRGFRTNPYIGTPPGETGDGVPATGHITIEPEMVRPETLLSALRWGGQHIGIGASRKMGWGRFRVISMQ